jgi:hypothetical protein
MLVSMPLEQKREQVICDQATKGGQSISSRWPSLLSMGYLGKAEQLRWEGARHQVMA